MSIKRDFQKGDFLHITNRGNRKQRITYDNQDREYLKAILFQSSEKFSNRIIAYCFMENHYHLLTKANGRMEISKMMQIFGQKTSRYFNQKYKTVGRLYQAPYWHNKIDSELHLLLTSRYIHRNPLDLPQIKSLSKLRDYEWSSLHNYLDDKPTFISVDEIMIHFKTKYDYYDFLTENNDKDALMAVIKVSEEVVESDISMILKYKEEF